MMIDDITTLPVFHRSLVDKCWYQLTTVLNFGILKRIQVAEFKFESKFEPLQVIWQSLLKAIPEDNQRF